MTPSSRARQRLLLAATALVAVASAGCGTIPTTGAVHLGREVAAGGARVDFDVRVLPPPPAEGDSPGDVVHGFLVASVNADDDSSIARQYLTRSAAAAWDPLASVTLYDEPSLSIDVRPGATVVVSATRLGIVGADGDYRPAPGSLSVTLHLQREGNEWRIKDPPKGRLSMTLDAARSSRPQDVFFLDPSQQVVVPDRVLFRVPRNGLPTALVRALVAGPTGWLRPAVVTAFPAGTRLLGNVPVNNGVADVNLSREVLNATPQARPALSAQIVWTLRQLPTVTAVRVFADGVPLTVPGVGQRQPTDAWEQYDPDALGDSRLRYVADGAIQIDGVGPIPASPSGSLSRPAVARNGSVVAAVVATRSKATVYYGSAKSRLTPRVSGAAVTTPSFDRSEVAWTVVTARSGVQRVVRLLPSGQVDQVQADALLRLGDVRELHLSRDATRVAAVVAERGSTRLVVGRVIAGRSGTWTVDGFRDPLPQWSDIAGVAWSDAEHVVTLARPPSPARTRRVPVQTDVTGYALTALPVNGLPPDVDDLAAGPGRPIVAASGDGMWVSTLGTWRNLGRGADPTYPG